MHHPSAGLSPPQEEIGPGQRGLSELVREIRRERSSTAVVAHDSKLATVSLRDAVAIVRLRQERLTDPEVIAGLSKQLAAIAATPGVLGMVVDFGHVRQASSGLFAALTQVRNLVAKRLGKIAVAGMPEQVAQAMRLVHLDQVMGLHDDLEAAVEACRSPLAGGHE